jgi:hypothetical protein
LPIASNSVCAASPGMPQPVRTPFETLHGSIAGGVVGGVSQAENASPAAMLAPRRPAGTLSSSLAQAGAGGGRLAKSGGSEERRTSLEVCGNPMAHEMADRTRYARIARRFR